MGEANGSGRFAAAGRTGRLAVFVTLALFLAAGTLLLGCSALEETSDSTSESESSSASVEADTEGMDFEYTSRDLDSSYDEATAVSVALNGSTAECDGDGVVVDGSTVTLVSAGTYVLSGTLDDGQIVVEAGDEDKVQIVLDGVSVHNEDGPAIYIKNADKCFITLADGSENALTDGADYVLEDGSDEPYATLFSKDDLTLNGSGSLSVTSSYRHAVCSKDDLVITGGTYVIDAAEDALRGRDCVKICDGEFLITAGGDGIKSNNDEDSTRGFVSIDGGTFSIDAGDDGIQAVTYMRVMGGAVDVEAADDAMHSDGEALIAGGSLSIEAVDDAVHAETALTIDDGTVDVSSCYEGYEAEKVYINGGTTHIVADDDAINAASADSGAAETDGAAEAAGTAETAGEGDNERLQDGGVPQGGMMEDGGMGAGDENCLIQVNGGYTVVDAAGDGVDSNGSIEVNGGVFLVSGPESGNNGALDYDISATVNGGTMIAVGSMQMAQNLSGGEQPFAYVTASGSAGDSVAVVDENGTVLCSFAPNKGFASIIVTCSQLSEGETYSMVVGGDVSDANEDGYADTGSVSGGASTDVTASTTASGGMGGLGADGAGMPAGQPGDVRQESRGGMGSALAGEALSGDAPADMSGDASAESRGGSSGNSA